LVSVWLARVHVHQDSGDSSWTALPVLNKIQNVKKFWQKI
jgi:hypothetical protein